MCVCGNLHGQAYHSPVRVHNYNYRFCDLRSYHVAES